MKRADFKSSAVRKNNTFHWSFYNFTNPSQTFLFDAEVCLRWKSTWLGCQIRLNNLKFCCLKFRRWGFLHLWWRNRCLVRFVFTDLSCGGILGNQSDCLMRIHCHKVKTEFFLLESGGRNKWNAFVYTASLALLSILDSCNTLLIYRHTQWNRCAELTKVVLYRYLRLVTAVYEDSLSNEKVQQTPGDKLLITQLLTTDNQSSNFHFNHPQWGPDKR